MAFKTSGTLRSRINSARSSTARTYRDNSSDAFVVYGPGAPSDVTIKRAGVTPGSADSLSSLSGGGTTISSVVITDSSYTTIDDTAINTAGGYAKILGTGFVSGCTVYLNGSAVTTTFISSTEVRVVIPATTNGTYSLMLFNPDTTGAIYLNLLFSDSPAWITGAGSIGSYYETQNVSNTVVANTVGNTSITYSLYSGNLPSGTTLSANGLLSGTAPAEASQTTYSFVVNATDAQNQNTTRSFNLTINTDVVTWSAPNEGTSYSVGANTAISNVSLSATNMVGGNISYSANALPSNVFLSGNVIYGTPNVVGNVSTLLTATSATTSRSNTRTISWVVSIATDEYFKYVTTLLSASTPTTLPFNDDASTNNFAVTINGDTRPYNFNPYTPGYYSNYFGGDGNYISAPYTAFQSVAGDFTIEAWFNPVDAGRSQDASKIGTIVSGGATGSVTSHWAIYFTIVSGVITTMNFSHNDVARVTATSLSLSTGSWNHVAVVRSGTTLTFYINGVSAATATYSTSITTNSTGNIQVARSAYGSTYQNWAKGNISNLRIVVGTAVYTSAFTPPTSPLTAISGTSLLTCQSNRFVDNSTNTYTVTLTGAPQVQAFIPYTPSSSYSTYGSTYFDGTGDYLQLPSLSPAMGSGSFTFECWIYPQSTASTNKAVYGWRNGADTSPYLFLNSTNVPTFGGDITNYLVSSTAITVNAWNHIAVVRSGTNMAMFLNGTRVGTATSSQNFSYSSGTDIGALNGASPYYFTGYISNLRQVTDTAVYDPTQSTITVPTTPLTAISGTSLLTCQSNQPVANNTFLDNSTNNFAITRNGNTTQGTFSPYGANWSYYFGSSTNAGLQYAYNSTNGAILAQGTAYTLEGWFYITTAASGNTVSTSIPIACSSASSASTASGRNWSFGSTTFGWYDRASSVWLTISWTPPLNQWFHLALVATSGTSFVLYINGTSVGTATDNTSYFDDSGYSFYLGSVNGNGTTTANGLYISNLRYSKTAVYSTTFTPSTTPLQPLASTTILTAQSPNFADKSPYNPVVTKPFAGTNSVQKFGPFSATTLPTPYYSAYFDGTGDYLTVPGNAAFNLYTGDWTIEYWYYHSADKLTTQISQGEYNWRIQQDGTSIALVTQAVNRITATSVSLYAWHHLALVSYNGTITLYIDGVSKGTTTVYPGNDSASTVYIGKNPATTAWDFNGYLSNIRIVKGTAVYTGAFTPPTSPLTAIANTSLLTCQSNTFVDNSTNNFTITANGDTKPTTVNPFTVTYSTSQSYTPSVYGGSAYFDGSSDSLALTTTTPLVMNTYPFTMEAWVYPTSYAHGFNIIQSRTYNGVGTGTYSLYVSTAGAVAFDQVQTPTTIITTASSAVPLNVWTHIAVVRNSSNVWYLYVNGVSSGTTAPTNAYDFSSTNTTYIGYNSDTNNYSSYGYISDVRVIKGQALYTSNFVPLNAPLQAVKNTTLLVNSTNAAMYDSSEMNNFESVGDAKISTTTVKYSGTTSMYFDGTGDWLYNNVGLLDFGTGDFTIEFWVYRNNTGNGYLFRSGGSSTNASVGQFGLYFESSNSTLTWQKTAGTTVQWTVSSSSITANNWFFITVVRQNGVFKVFYDGVSQTIASGSFTDSTSYSCVQPSVGGNFTNYNFNGYISDFRVTKGIARYTSNFSVPTSPFLQK